jgi:hypothetical protein
MHLQYAAASTDRDFTTADIMDFNSYSPNQVRLSLYNTLHPHHAPTVSGGIYRQGLHKR